MYLQHQRVGKNNFLIFVLTLLTLVQVGDSLAQNDGALTLRVEGGEVAGVVEDGLRVFRGIPFAAPPLGENRWRAPQPLNPWQGVLAATDFGDACIQGRPNDTGSFRDGVSEDCLYLNVWTPATSRAEKLPVMVWIYGGGFAGGATSVPLYSGEQLAQQGVIVVSIAYRVGALGFMAHPELSAETTAVNDGVRASGNYGLLDQIAGLQWVQNNIAAFGGDPNRVTIFGESAGGISVSMLAASPLAAGLFQGAISQSGGSFGPTRTPSLPGENIPSLTNAEQGGITLGEKFGAASLAEMRAANAATIVTNSGGVNGVGWPILDGWVIPDDQYLLYEQGKFNNTPILIGINSDEGATFTRAVESDAFTSQTKDRYGPYAETLRRHYFDLNGNELLQAARDLTRDAAFGWHTWTWARLQADHDNGAPVYVYFFDQRPPYPPGRSDNVKGAAHAVELPFMFGHLDQRPLPWREQDYAISQAMVKYWTNFAKRGDPNGEDLPTWPAFTSDKPMRLVFHQQPQAAAYDNLDALQAMDEYFRWRRTQEGKQFVRSATE